MFMKDKCSAEINTTRSLPTGQRDGEASQNSTPSGNLRKLYFATDSGSRSVWIRITIASRIQAGSMHADLDPKDKKM
jgi:hypothetical protein